jgi:hypothetical protein
VMCKKRWRAPLVTLVGLVALTFTQCRGERPGAQSPVISQDQITDSRALSERYRRATPRDAVSAQQWLKEAREAEARRRWGAAYKLYGESASLKPSPEAILGMSRARIEVPRERTACEETVLAKERDLQQARKLLEAAGAFARDTGLEVSASDLATTLALLARAEASWSEARQRCAAPPERLP